MWAVCLRCEKRDSTRVSGWLGLGLFFVKVIALLVGLILLIAFLLGDI